MKRTLLLLAMLAVVSVTQAWGVVYTGIMDNRAGSPFVPGFTAQSRALVTGGDEQGGLAVAWQVDDTTNPGSWTYTYTVVRNAARNKGLAFFDIETAADFTAVNILNRQVLSATNRFGSPISPAGFASITISDPVNFTAVHDFSNAPVTEAAAATALNKFDLSHYSGDPARVQAGLPGGLHSATPSVGPVPHPFYGVRVTFPGSFTNIVSFSYETVAWSVRIVTDRVPMWGHLFCWGDQTFVEPFWYANFYTNHIDNPNRLPLAPIDSLTGADPYQGWALVPGSLPVVRATNPAAGAPAVPVTEPVTAVFSGPMNAGSITAATFTLADGVGAPVAGTVSYDPATMSAAFTPNSPLTPNTTYTATITTGAVDQAGNPLNPPKIWTFTTTPQDNVPPTVTAQQPGNGATFVAITTPLTATFSEEINPATLTDATFTVVSGAGPVAGTVGYNPATRTATFTPNAPLTNNTLHTATITTGVTDLALPGNAVAAPVSWSFTTIPQETVLPMVTATVPADAVANVPLATPITATFSEAMDPATISAATFTLSDGLGGPVAGTVTYAPATLTATFTPNAPLLASTTYTATLTRAVRDLAGNPLPLAITWTFSTTAPDNTPPTVTGRSPFAGERNVQVTAIISAALSENVNPATVDASRVTVTGQSYATAAPFTVSGTVFLSSSGLTFPSALVIGSKLPFLGLKDAYAATQTLEITITDMMKEMVTHNAINDARCYFWIYKMKADGVDIPPECPGPSIYAINGDTIAVTITNALDEPHSFFIPGNLPGDLPIFDSGVINPGQTVGPLQFTASVSGAHLYYDNLNAPVNRFMGLHGALVVRPAAAAAGHNFTPYDNPTPHIQRLFDSFGDPNVFPGLKWEEGDPATFCPPFRQYVWVYHMASPNLQAEVGNLPPGQIMPARTFMDKIARDPFSATRNNGLPQYFTINGQSGFFSHFIPTITPCGRVGEPIVIHILNAGSQGVSHHYHCNHFYVASINGAPNPNPIWIDIYGIKPMDRIDYVFPFMRPPDIANVRGIGRPDRPLTTASGQLYWPPKEEMETHIPPSVTPPIGTLGVPTDINGVPLNMGQRLSPLCYPAHDHLESSQTAQGGNYNQGLIAGAYLIGDRNAQSQGLGNWMNFPMDPDFFQMFRNIRGLAVDGVNGTREAAGPRTSAG